MSAARVAIPPISFVRKQLMEKRSSARVSDGEWNTVLKTWSALPEARKQQFRDTPLKGLFMPRRFEGAEKAAWLAKLRGETK